jgi:uncharacterized protein (DUF1800 family)
VRQGEFRDQPAAHDDGEKEILGQTGKWTGDDLVTILLQQPATSQRLAWRLTSEFFGEGVVGAEALAELAGGLRKNNLDLRWGLETILRSELFFSQPNIGSRICDPVSFLIGRLRALECGRQSPSTLVLAEWISRMGQDLFYPPNVGGWSGGRAWLSTRTIIARTNCMAALVAGSLNSPARPLEIDQLIAKHSNTHDAAKKLLFLSRLLTGEETAPHETETHVTLLRLLTEPRAHLH